MKHEDIYTIKDAAAYFLETYSDVFTEAHYVCGAIEIVARMRKYRIEPIESIGRRPKNFNVRLYELDDEIWRINSSFAYCSRDDEVSVIMQALSFLHDRLRAK